MASSGVNPGDFAPLREAILKSAKDSSDPEVLVKVATILNYGAESDKRRVETVNLERSARTESLRFFVPIVAPLVSALAVVGALIFQTVQFRETSRIQRETVAIQKQTVDVQARSADDTQWREAVKTFTQGSSVMTGFAGTALLLAFLQEGSHREEARAMALSVLGGVTLADVFEPLWDATLQATPDSEKVGTSVRMTKRLKREYSRAFSDQKNLEGPKPDEDLPSLTDQSGTRFPNPYFVTRQINLEMSYVCNSLASRLRTSRPALIAIDLRDAALWDCDLSGVDLSKAVLDGAALLNVKVDNADFGGVEKFADTEWAGTAWWRAKRSSLGLLEYLTKKFPFRAKNYYEGGATTQDEYRSHIERLRSPA